VAVEVVVHIGLQTVVGQAVLVLAVLVLLLYVT
jgi:hypothetical protein